MIQTKQLGEISQIQFGVHLQPEEEGHVFYLQAKHFDTVNELTTVDTWVPPDSTGLNHLLKHGDILLASKGYRNFAWLYESSVGPAVASSIFFVIKPNNEIVLPGFLSMFFNLSQTQQHFRTLGAGSSIPSIRKSELEALHITIPPLDIQQKLVALRAVHEQGLRISRQIIAEKESLFESVARKIIHEPI